MPTKLASGYMQLNTNIHRKQYEHRVVWEQYNGKVPQGVVVHHINGNKADNRIENLKLMPISKHARLPHLSIRGVRHPRWHFIKIKELCLLWKAGYTLRELAKQYKVSSDTITRHLREAGCAL